MNYSKFRATPVFTGLITALLMCTFTAGAVRAQDLVSKEERSMQLQLEAAQVELDNARSVYNEVEGRYRQMQELKEKGIITGDELNKIRKEYEEAEVTLKLAGIALEKTNLQFLSDASVITIVQAQKYKNVDGRDMVRITLRNSSNLAQARLVSSVDESALRELLRLKNIRISILSDYMMVGDPYEVVVPALEYQRSVDVVFALRQKDLSNVVLQMKYLGQTDERNIYLEKRSEFDIVSITCPQFSQEGRLGYTVGYGLTLERLAEDENTYTLDLVNMPAKYRFDFRVDDKQISQIKFPRGVSKQEAVLQVYVPEKLPGGELNVPVPFYMVVSNREAVSALNAMKGAVDEKKLQEYRIGYEKLELIPIGVAEMELYLPNLYLETPRGEPGETKMTLKNKGTVELTGITFTSVLPFDWELEVEPRQIARVAPGEQATVLVRIKPPAGGEPGKYEVKLRAGCEYLSKAVESTEKNVNVMITSRSNLIGSTVLILLLVGMVVGVAVFTVKISRR